MKLLRLLLPASIPPHIPLDDDLTIMRERIFQTMMLAASLISSVVYVLFVRNALLSSHWADTIFFTIVFIIIWCVTLLRIVPFSIRSTVILLIVYLVSVYSLAQSGLSGHAQIFLLSFVILSAILAGVRALIISFTLGIVTLFLFASLLMQGWIPAPLPGINGNTTSQFNWLVSGVSIALLTALTGIPLVVIIQNLQKSLHKQKELSAHLEVERSNLEVRVASRTADLERRVLQLRTASEISRSISSVLDPNELLQQVVNLLAERANLYYVGAFLLNDNGTYAILKAGSGDAGRDMVAEGHRLQVGGSSMIGWTTATGQPRIALDVGEESVHFDNPHLPLTRSELALPIMNKNKVIGALTIQSDLENAFDENDILVFQSIADSLGVAIDNAQLFQQNQRDLEEIRALNQQYLRQAWMEVKARSSLEQTYQDPTIALHQECSPTFQMPIVVREQPIGRIALDTGGKELTSEETAMVEAITTQTALALESARLLEETQRRARLEEKINRMTTNFWRAADIKDVLQTALITLAQLPAVSEVAVHLMPMDHQNDFAPVDGNSKADLR